MDITHTLCEHKYRAHKMQRIDKRVKGNFVPVAWTCLECGQMQND